MKKHGGFVYIMTNHKMGTLYIGVTSDLENRVIEHRTGKFPDSFTNKYKLHTLVYYECFDCMQSAINREKQLKNWKRDWKLVLIIDKNPDWDDLYDRAFKSDMPSLMA